MAITAKGAFNGHDLTDIPVLNPGDWFGKAWLLEIGGCYWPLFLVVEADSVNDAIDELADNEKYGQTTSSCRMKISAITPKTNAISEPAAKFSVSIT